MKQKLAKISGALMLLSLCIGGASTSSAKPADVGQQLCRSILTDASISQCRENGKDFIRHQDGLGVEKPQRGTEIEQSVQRTSGVIETLKVSVDLGGKLTTSYANSGISLSSQPIVSALTTGLDSTNCGSPSYNNPLSGKVTLPSEWWFKEANKPDSHALYRIKEAFLTWSSGANRCNSTIVPTSYRSSYMGVTTLGLPYQGNPWLAGFGDCLQPGSKDIVGWDFMDSGLVATTCTSSNLFGFTNPRTSIIFNMMTDWYTGLDPLLCTGQVTDLKGLATHSVGISLRLGEYNHVGQTMSPTLSFCDVKKRGLGYGDVHGVANKYPAN